MIGAMQLSAPPAVPEPDTTEVPEVVVLIVDDNAKKRLALKSVLTPLGYRVVEADSGIAALPCLLDDDFAVILLDVRMPIMDGFETSALIRQRRQSEMTPIIFITANGSDEIAQTDRYAEGAVDFIFSPINPAELRAKVSVFANLFVRAAMLADRARTVQTVADQLRLLTDAAPIGIFQTDADYRYVSTNAHWSAVTGISSEAAAGRSWDFFIDAATRDELAAGRREDASLRTSCRFEVPLPGSEPRVGLLISRSVPAPDGRFAGWVGTLADVTAEARSGSCVAGAARWRTARLLR